jgi:hypothetical protein
MTRKSVIPTLLTMSAMIASFAWGHDLWLVAQDELILVGKDTRLLAHTGMKFPQSLSAVTPDRLDGAWIIDANGRRDLKNAAVDGNSLAFPVRFETPGIALAAIAVKPKFIHLEAEEFNEYLDHDGLPQILELRKKRGELDKEGREMYAKFAKAILKVGEGGPSDLATKPAGLRIEIVPLEDPTQLGSAGNELPVRVLFEGKPFEGVFVYPLAEGEEVYTTGYETDADGKAQVPIKTTGLWSLHCIYMRPYADRNEADWESFFATVTFQVRPAPSS